MLERLRQALRVERWRAAPVEGPVPCPPDPPGPLDGPLKRLKAAPDEATKQLLANGDFVGVLAAVKTIKDPSAAQEVNRAYALAVLAAKGQPTKWQEALAALDRAGEAPGAGKGEVGGLIKSNRDIISAAAAASGSGRGNG